MLSSNNRLSAKKDFEVVRDKGTLFQSTSFALAYYKRGDSNDARFGIIVSSKISPNASKRNYLRRGFAEGIRQNISTIKKGYDCVVLAKPAAAKKYVNELMPEMTDALKKAGLLG